MLAPSKATIAIRFELAKSQDDDYPGVTHIDIHMRSIANWTNVELEELGEKIRDELHHSGGDLLGPGVNSSDFDIVTKPVSQLPPQPELPGHWYRPGPESGSLAARACGCGVICSKIVIRFYTNQWHIWHTNKDVEVRIESASHPQLITEGEGILGALQWADKVVSDISAEQWAEINEGCNGSQPTGSCS